MAQNEYGPNVGRITQLTTSKPKRLEGPPVTVHVADEAKGGDPRTGGDAQMVREMLNHPLEIPLSEESEQVPMDGGRTCTKCGRLSVFFSADTRKMKRWDCPDSYMKRIRVVFRCPECGEWDVYRLGFGRSERERRRIDELGEK